MSGSGRSDAVDAVLELFALPQADTWYDETVTERQHALQAAALAVAAEETDAVVVAALLHDVGHLIVKDFQPLGEALTADAHHEVAGARFLRRFFGPEVADAVRWHVAAKRYLCATEPGYAAALSPSSVRSMVVQGGDMSGAEVTAFEQQPHHLAAVAVRRFDDAAKVPDAIVPDLETYRPLLERLLVESQPS